MKTIKANTKKGQEFKNAYEQSKHFDISECYENASRRKYQAQAQCYWMMMKEHGDNFRILSYNTFHFTCGWRLPNGDIRIETATNSYKINAL